MTVRSQASDGIAEIERLFHGRRGAPRTACRRAIVARCGRRSFRGVTVNVSPLGALLEIRDERFLPVGVESSLMAVVEAVRRVFPRGLRIRFRRAGIAVEATVVRVASAPDIPASVIGCAFAAPLTRSQCEALGIAHARGDASDGRLLPGIAEL